MKAKPSLGLLLCTALLLSLLPATTARATRGSDLAVSGDAGYTYSTDGVLTFMQDGTYLVSMTTAGATTTTDRIVVANGVTANITLNGVAIQLPAGCAFNIAGAAVNLTLTGNNTLQSGAHSAGLSCPIGAALTISGSGSLTASGGEYGAGIGGGLAGGCGAVTISSGTVTASGGRGDWGGAAGIGSGANCTEENGGGIVTISGGTVTAHGAASGGAGIGGGGFDGCAGYGGTVFISGGLVTATGYGGGAGIGAGSGGGWGDHVSGGAVTISGGTVIASGNGDRGAGIGSGWGSDGASITIRGGSVNASSLDEAPVNQNGVNVYRTTVTLESLGAAIGDAAVCTLATNAGYAYGTKDLKTDADGKLYLYLPADTLTGAAQTTDGAAPPAYTTYRGSIRTADDGKATGVLSAGAAPTQSVLTGGSISFTALELGLGPLTITAIGTDIDSGIATAARSGGRVTVTGVAAGSTSLTVTYNNGSAEIVPIAVQTPQGAGDFVVATDNSAGYSYNPGGGTLLFSQPGSYAVSMKSGITKTTSGRIQVNGGTSAEPIRITLSDVGIQSASCAFELQGSSYVHLLLAGGTTSTLTSGKEYAGIQCGGGATLVIDGPGELRANGGAAGAGIGNGIVGDGGTICINSGIVIARGGNAAALYNGGAGIGGGYYGHGGIINISGGTVDAAGGSFAAGIGGGQSGVGGKITISGGIVTAGGGAGGGAGIGCGAASDGYLAETTTIAISGGTITAKGNDGAAGIGDGSTSVTPFEIHVYISGGSVNAQGSAGAQDIGKGINSLADIVLQSAKVGGVNVYRTTVQLAGLTEARDMLDLITSAGYAYGINGMKSDAEGKLYLYLPLGTATTAARAGGSVYTGSVATTDDPLTSMGTLTLQGEQQGAFRVETTRDYSYGVDGVLRIFQPGDYTVSMSEGVAQTSRDRIVIDAPSSTEANPVRLTVNNVKIIHEGNTAPCALEVKPSSAVSLTLVGQDNTLKSGRDYAGLGCPAGATLAIGGAGSLTATGGSYGAGIGGGRNRPCGQITIASGTVCAYNNYGAAGIGGGFGDGVVCDGGHITITGGKVTASGGSGMGAGLGGGGNGGSGGNITISGGSVAATGGSMSGAAGIGGGEQGSGGNITITGGTISATGGGNGGIAGAGIGGGNTGAGGTVVITGGSINAAPGGSGAEAIGHGTGATDSGSLKNNRGADVFLTTITLQGVNTVTAVTVFLASRAYGIHDVFTDARGRLYFYLPQSTLTTAAETTSGTMPAVTRRYGGAITTTAGHTASGTLYLAGDTSQLAVPSSLSWDTTIPGKATWVAVADASGYSVQLYKDGTALGSAVHVPTGTACDFTTAIEAAGSGSYTFKVTALADGTIYTDSEQSPASEEYGYTAPSAPSAPQGLSATPGDGQVTLSWSAPTSDGGATISGYEVSKDGGANWTDADSSTGHTFGGLTNGTSYTFMVRAANRIGAGAAATAVATPQASPTTYTITAAAESGGSISPSGAVPVAQGSSITFTITADASYSVLSVYVDGSDQGALSSYTFNNVAGNHTISATFQHTGGGDDPDYIPRNLTDSATGIIVSGSSIHKDAVLTVTDVVLHAPGVDPACDAIRQRMNDDAYGLLLLKDISLSPGFSGTLTITIPLGAQYNGQTVTILHCAKGTLKTYGATVRDGKATFSVTSLSPLAVFAPLSVAPPPCTRADVVAVLYGAPEGTPVRAWVGGTEQPTLYTAHDAFGRQAVLWTFYPPQDIGWTVRVEPQLPAGLAGPRWQYRLVWIEPPAAGSVAGHSAAGVVTISRCSGAVLRFQLVDTDAP
ncbi:MAG TPA: fibronectin type III domain-containing protein [Anaerolineae bacterium]|nr:fibronectin type III domain-containing protein [Anaerolineae bacterium]